MNGILATDVHDQVVKGAGQAKGDGVFMPACFDHCGHIWDNSPTIDGTTVQEALGNWFFGRSGPTQLTNMDNDAGDLQACPST